MGEQIDPNALMIGRGPACHVVTCRKGLSRDVCFEKYGNIYEDRRVQIAAYG